MANDLFCPLDLFLESCGFHVSHFRNITLCKNDRPVCLHFSVQLPSKIPRISLETSLPLCTSIQITSIRKIKMRSFAVLFALALLISLVSSFSMLKSSAYTVSPTIYHLECDNNSWHCLIGRHVILHWLLTFIHMLHRYQLFDRRSAVTTHHG